MPGEILVGEGFRLRRLDLGGQPLEIDVAVAGQPDGQRVPAAVHLLDHHDHVLQRVGGLPGPVRPREVGVRMINQRVDRRRVRSVLGVGGRGVVVRHGRRRQDPDGFDVGGIASRRTDEGVLAVLGHREELLARRPAHRPRHRVHDHVVEAQPVEDLDVRPAVGLVGLLESGVVDVEGVRVLHHELPAPQQPGPRPRLVAVLRLDLVEVQRQILVGGVEVLDQQREHLLVRRTEQVVVALAVLQPEHAVAVVGPATGRLVRLARQQGGEVHLLRADRVHLLPDDLLDVAQHLIAQRQPAVDARARPAGCSRRAAASGGSAPRRRPGPRAACGRTVRTCG